MSRKTVDLFIFAKEIINGNLHFFVQCLRKITDKKIADNLPTFYSGIYLFLLLHNQKRCESKTLDIASF